MENYIMKNEERLVFDGYLYGNEEDVNLAKEERKTARFLQSKINYDDIQMALKIYDKAIKDKIFKTPVGFEFLKVMRFEMIKRGMPADNIQPIPLYLVFSKEAEQRPVRIFQVKERDDKLKENFRISLWANIAMIILVIGMFVITLFGDNTNIVNYRYKIENEFVSWEQELEEREAIVREKEAALGIE